MKTKTKGALTTAYIRGRAVAYADMNAWRTWFDQDAPRVLTRAEYEEIETWHEQMHTMFRITHKFRK